MLASHPLSKGKGQLIQDRQHTRDRSKGIAEWMETLCPAFTDPEMARAFLEQIRQNYPRYIRDQLQLIGKTLEQHPQWVVSQALEICITKKLYSANDLRDVAQVVKKRTTPVRADREPHGSLSTPLPRVLDEKVEKRSMDVYVSAMTNCLTLHTYYESFSQIAPRI